MSWFPTWLPELPALNLNLTLPTSIQGRFLSFILKRTLGHFFKPGQLDVRQIDSQIGSGFVQVNDLELDSGAINNLLSGLPLTLTSGTLSSATVRIPWPNPLTSTLGFSLNSLHLTLETSSAASGLPPDIDLASSVASVAETFLHEELSPREGASLMDSFHHEFPTVNVEKEAVPGALDPFAMESDGEPRRDMEPGGISLLATLIERLLSRFEFDAQDIQVTIIHPGNVSITLALSECRYTANIKKLDNNVPLTDGSAQGVTRSLAVSGITLRMRDMQPAVPQRSGSTATIPSSPLLSAGAEPHHHVYQSRTPSSSSSSLDEETQMAMSQSLASLPPRPPSVASTMYQSALSVVNEMSEDAFSDSAHVPPTTPINFDTGLKSTSFVQEEMVFSSGPTPLTVQIAALPLMSDHGGHISDGEDRMMFSVRAGILAFAFRAWHIGGLLRLVSFITSQLPKSAAPPSTKIAATGREANISSFDIESSLDVRGVVILFLPSSFSSLASNGLETFFLHPLIPPSLSSGYTRLHIEVVAASLVLYSNPKGITGFGAQTRAGVDDHVSMKGSFSIHNISVFVFQASREDNEVLAFPVLFVDPDLPNQYHASHHHPAMSEGVDKPLPYFDVLDWTEYEHQRRGAARLSYWRCKPIGRRQARRRAQESHQTGAFVPDHEENPPDHLQSNHTFTCTFEKSQNHRKRSSQLAVDGELVPLHLFLDLNTILGDDSVLRFIEGVTGSFDPVDQTKGADYPEELEKDGTPPATPQRRHIHDPVKEGKRLESIFHDLDPKHDYEDLYLKTTHQDRPSKIKDEIRLSLYMAAIRFEIRVPPPRNTPRSGALVIDVHNIEIRNGFKRTEPHARFQSFGPEPELTSNPAESRPVLDFECRRVLISHSLVGQSLATALLSLGPLSESSGWDSPDRREPLRPRFSVIKSQTNSVVITALNIEFPSAHIVVSKELLDGLQYFIDDASQLLERYSQRTAKLEREGREGGDVSLIGSRFFVKSRSGSALMGSSVPHQSETVVKMSISEAFLRAWVPRTDSGKILVRPLDVSTSELNILIELKPEGKEETIITLGILDVKIQNMFKTGKSETLLTLTSPRSLMSTPRPLVKLRFASLMAPGTTAKETRLKLTLCDFTCNIFPDIDWAKDLGLFVKSPPGTFETVIPSERTSIALKILDGSIRAYAPTRPGAIVVYIGDSDLTTDITGKSPESSFALGIQHLALLALDDTIDRGGECDILSNEKGAAHWKSFGYALIVEIAGTNTVVSMAKTPPLHVDLVVDGIQLHLHLAADTLTALSSLINDIASSFNPSQDQTPQVAKEPVVLSHMSASRNLLASVEDIAFQRPPEIGPAPDMIHDDLPTNPDYLDESFGTAAGLRAFSDDELDELDNEDDDFEISDAVPVEVKPGDALNVNGEIIKVHPEGVNMIEEYYDNLPAEVSESPVSATDSKLKVRIRGGDATLFLYDGYDWVRTRKVIEEEIKEMRRRLAKIRQLVANGQVQDYGAEETSAVLFNSVYIGIDQEIDAEEPGALLAAIDDELREDAETSTQSSWQSLRPTGTTPTVGKQRARTTRIHSKKLTRSKGPSMEFKLMGLHVNMDQFHPDEILVSKTFVTVRDVEILDHIKTSTWKKFLTALRSDSRGNIRETGSDMVRIELRGVRPAPGHPSEEARLRAKILPLRLYVDQDAVDFLKKFFSFKDTNDEPSGTERPPSEAYIQLAEIFPVDLKLDYKPRRVDYRALREGRTIELMNFFHFDGAEMTLRHITLAGVTGWSRLFEMLNDLWTPDVKATQLVDVISGVAPIRSVVNVGSGVADLVLLPISQYKKDGRIVRGMQKGATAFVKSTAIEAIKMGARLATGTQVILEQAESVLGGQFKDSYMTETLQVPTFDDAGRLSLGSSDEEDSESDLISKYAEQPTDIREGFQFAYQSLRRNLNSAAQTILAVPMEVYEKSGSEGPVRSVVRAVPIAVLKPMIGASEAISKTLLGLHNTLDPNVRGENEAKYKHR